MPRIRLSSIDPPEVTPRLLDTDGDAARCSARISTCPCRPAPTACCARMRRLYDARLVRDVAAEIRRRAARRGARHRRHRRVSRARATRSSPRPRRCCATAAVHLLPRLSLLAADRHHGGEGERPSAGGGDPRARAQALRRLGRRKRREAFAAALRRPRARRAGRDDARPRQRPAGRLQPQLRARAASTARMRSPTARCACGRVAREGDRLRGERVGRRRCGSRSADDVPGPRGAARLRFLDRSLLEAALTHPSALPAGAVRAGEQLEFLGDAVLDLVIADLLLCTFPISTRASSRSGGRRWCARRRWPTRRAGSGSARRCASAAARIAAAAARRRRSSPTSYEAVLGADVSRRRLRARTRGDRAPLQGGPRPRRHRRRAGLEDDAAGAHPGARSAPCPSTAVSEETARRTRASSPPRCGSPASTSGRRLRPEQARSRAGRGARRARGRRRLNDHGFHGIGPSSVKIRGPAYPAHHRGEWVPSAIQRFALAHGMYFVLHTI